MSFGLTADGFKIKRLADILDEIRQEYRNQFGNQIDLSDGSPFGQQIAIHADRESKLWELAQAVYDSQYPATAEGKQLDNVVSLTGTTRLPAQFSKVNSGVARGANGTVVPAGTIISVQGNSSARFVTQADATINIADGATFKTAPIELVAEETGPIAALAGTLTVIETPVAGLNSFTNTADAEVGSNTELDPDLKQRRDGELQIAGAATREAIRSELSARELVEAVIVFSNLASIEIDGRPPKSVDIVVLGDTDQNIAESIFKVVADGIETIGDISVNVVDSQGFNNTVKFSRPTEVPIYLELDLTIDANDYPADGDDQVEAAILAYAELLTVGQDVVVYGSKALINALGDIPGITDVVTRVDKVDPPADDNNVVIEPREIAKFDSARITIAQV